MRLKPKKDLWHHFEGLHRTTPTPLRASSDPKSRKNPTFFRIHSYLDLNCPTWEKNIEVKKNEYVLSHSVCIDQDIKIQDGRHFAIFLIALLNLGNRSVIHVLYHLCRCRCHFWHKNLDLTSFRRWNRHFDENLLL